MLIRARPRDLGGIMVDRVLPSMARRMVGPWIFFDHFGPADAKLDVRPHPHINLATVTYLFEGRVHHRDSLGSDVFIEPGQINWMSAARGIAHSERAERQQVHGLQLWVALPSEHEEDAPTFQAHRDLPQIADNIRLLAGEAFGVRSPVTTLSPLFYLDARLTAGQRLELPKAGERAVYVVEGDLDGVPARTMFVPPHSVSSVVALRDSRVMALGGEPLGERNIWWNFVSSSKERIEQAKEDWRQGRFAKIPGDAEEFIPLPE
jgi:redox-sensitive bicupin YhaK (pirin superfamily)